MTRQPPTQEESRASHAVLIEVLNVLGGYREGLVVIGGWVPELMFPQQGHVGSLDVDLAVDGRRIPPSAYDTIPSRLSAAGYRQAAPGAGVFRKQVGASGCVTVKLDLVSSHDRGTPAADGGAAVHGLNLGRLRGVQLAFDDAVGMTLRGTLPDGTENTVQARVAGVPAFLCMKAFALSERLKPKDAYDISFCLRHFPGGPAALAKAAQPLMTCSDGRAAREILREKFRSVQSVGPQWAADVAGGQGGDRETIARDAYERFQRFDAGLDA